MSPPPRPPKNVNIHVPSPKPTPPSTQERQPKPDKVKPKNSVIFVKPKQPDRKVIFEDDVLPAIPIRQKNQGVNTNDLNMDYESPNRASPMMQRSLYENTTPPPTSAIFSEPVINPDMPQPLYTKAYPRGNYTPYHLPWQHNDLDSGDSEEYDQPPPIAPRPPHTKIPSPLMPPTRTSELSTPSMSTDSQRSTSPKPRKQTRFADAPTDIPDSHSERSSEPSSVAAEILHDDRPPGVPHDAFSYIIPQSNQPIRNSPTTTSKPPRQGEAMPPLPDKQSRDQSRPPNAFSYIVPPPPPEEEYDSRSSRAYDDDDDEYEEYDAELPANIPPIPPSRTPKSGDPYYDHPKGVVPQYPQYPDTYIPLTKGYKPKHETANMIPAQQPMRGVITRKPQKAVKIASPDMMSPENGKGHGRQRGDIPSSNEGMPPLGQSPRGMKSMGPSVDNHRSPPVSGMNHSGKPDDRYAVTPHRSVKASGINTDGQLNAPSQDFDFPDGPRRGHRGAPAATINSTELPRRGRRRDASFDDASSATSFGTGHGEGASSNSGISGISGQRGGDSAADMNSLGLSRGGPHGASFDDTSSAASFGTAQGEGTSSSSGISGLSGLSSLSGQIKAPMQHQPHSPLAQRSLSPRNQASEQTRSPLLSLRSMPPEHQMPESMHTQQPHASIRSPPSMRRGYGADQSSQSGQRGPPPLEPRSHIYANHDHSGPGQASRKNPLLEPRGHTYENHTHGQPNAQSPLMSHRPMSNQAPRSLSPADQVSGRPKQHRPQAPMVASLTGSDTSRPPKQSPPTPPPIFNYDNLKGLPNGVEAAKPMISPPTKIPSRSASPKKAPPPTAPKPKMRSKPPIAPSRPKEKQERLSAAESEELDQLIEELQSMGQWMKTINLSALLWCLWDNLLTVLCLLRGKCYDFKDSRVWKFIYYVVNDMNVVYHRQLKTLCL